MAAMVKKCLVLSCCGLGKLDLHRIVIFGSFGTPVQDTFLRIENIDTVIEQIVK
jgi:hypothetical protein